MADIETLELSEHTSKAEGVNGVQDQSSVQGSSAKSTEDGHSTLTKLDPVSSEPSSATPSPGTGPVPLRETTPNGATSGASTVPTLSVPHPKKFAHSNINKKFLEKTSSASTSGIPLSNATTAKPGISNRASQTVTLSQCRPLILYLARHRETRNPDGGIAFKARHSETHSRPPTIHTHRARMVAPVFHWFNNSTNTTYDGT